MLPLLTGLLSKHFSKMSARSLRSSAKADRDTSVSLSLVVKPALAGSSPILVHSTKKSHHKGRIYFVGRIDWTRTSDLFDPNEAFYQAELQSVCFCVSLITSIFLQEQVFFCKKMKKIWNFTMNGLYFLCPCNLKENVKCLK